MKKALYPIHQIELRLTEMAELFNLMDPTPFHHRNLDIDAEDFLESWALDFPQNSHFKIIIHIEKIPMHLLKKPFITIFMIKQKKPHTTCANTFLKAVLAF